MDLTTANRADVARATGYTQGGISKIFSGKRRPSVTAAQKIAEALGISVDEFLSSLPRD